jgi:hypothetical protein
VCGQPILSSKYTAIPAAAQTSSDPAYLNAPAYNNIAIWEQGGGQPNELNRNSIAHLTQAPPGWVGRAVGWQARITRPPAV